MLAEPLINSKCWLEILDIPYVLRYSKKKRGNRF